MYNSLYSYSTPDYTAYTSYTPYTGSTASVASLGTVLGALIGAFIGVIITVGIIAVLVCIARWFVFKKANRKPWESLIPVHSTIVEMELGGVETYWYFLTFTTVIPFVGWIGPLVLMFWKNIALAKSFGKGAGYGVLLTFFPFVMYPMLAWGSAKYVGPANGSKTADAKSKEK